MEQFYYLFPNPQPVIFFYIITSKALSMKPAPDGHNHCNCQRSLYPLVLLMHSFALFSSYFDGKDISGLPQSKSRMEVSKALIFVAVFLTTLPPFQVNFCTETELLQPSTLPLSFYSTNLHLPGCSSQAS